jgi:N-methylhydantoinase A/oxoprolinase/acetone carboxylase beta subunit
VQDMAQKRGEAMLLGIDVGGTFTDAAVLNKQKIIAKAKKTTTHECLLTGILAAMDEVLEGHDLAQIERIALSTTTVTNALLEAR